jgi:putative endonuclease
MRWFVYILRCGNGDLYTGVTTDVSRRLGEHQSGIGGRFTRANRPIELIYQEPLETEHEAKRREAQIKGWTRAKKLKLVNGSFELLKQA